MSEENESRPPFKRPFRHFTTPQTDNKEIVFGIQSVLETLRSGKEIDRLLVQRELGNAEILDLAKEKGVQVQKVPLEKLNRITRKNHQGAIAFVSAIHYAKLENVIATTFEKGQVPLVLILDRITDVRNFGAIIRTAECTGVDGIIIQKSGGAPINGDTVKTSAGAVFNIPICKVDHIKDAMFYLQASEIKVIAATEKTENTIYDVDFKQGCAVIMGSEDRGINPSILKLVDDKAKLPMYGSIASLNVSVACGAFLYEVVRQRL